MSSGRFVRSRYTDDDGEIHPIRVQPETLAATLGGTANAAPTGATTADNAAKVTKGRREYGLGARFVTVAWNPGAAPEDYDERTLVKIPVLNPTVFNGANIGAAVVYNGGTGVIVSKTGESVK